MFQLETVRVWHDEESGAETPTDDFITKRKQLEDTVEKGEARKKEFLVRENRHLLFLLMFLS